MHLLRQSFILIAVIISPLSTKYITQNENSPLVIILLDGFRWVIFDVFHEIKSCLKQSLLSVLLFLRV